jgi:hypothetical protein
MMIIPKLLKVPLFVPVINKKRRLDLGIFGRRQDAESTACKHSRNGSAETVYVSQRSLK